MSVTRKRILITLGAALLGGAAYASPYNYAAWTSATYGNAGSADGSITLADSSIVGVHYSGEVASPTQVNNTGINYWATDPSTYTSANIDNGPATADIIALTGIDQMTYTVSFDHAVSNVAFDLLSVGQSGNGVTYNFDQAFTLENNGPGYWGDGPLTQMGNSLLGVEGHGVILFSGSVSSISWTVTGTEFWHGFQVGTLATPVPEPTTWAGLGLGTLLLIRRKRRK